MVKALLGMRRASRVLLSSTCWLALNAPSEAVAQVFRCSLANGTVVYQEVACGAIAGAKEEKTEWTAERERAAALAAKRELDRKASIEASEKEARAKGSRSSSDRIDCTDLYAYARARGSGWMESTAIVQEAESKGTCVRSK